MLKDIPQVQNVPLSYLKLTHFVGLMTFTKDQYLGFFTQENPAPAKVAAQWGYCFPCSTTTGGCGTATAPSIASSARICGCMTSWRKVTADRALLPDDSLLQQSNEINN